MKIAIVLPAVSLFSVDRPNSMETVIRTLVPAAEPDETIRIFCDAGAADHGDLNVQTVASGAARARDMIAALKAWDPDVIEFHQHIKSASHIARRFPNKTRLLYRHNDVKAPRSWIGRWRYAHRHRPFEGFVFVSDASRQTFLKDYPSLADRAFTVRNPIDAALWRSDVKLRDKLIVFSGRAIPEKGLDLLCQALPDVLNAHPDWRAALFLGDWAKHAEWAGPHVERLTAASDQADVYHDALLTQVRACLQRASIAVVPSVWAEPLGLVALEAHAAGVALISSGRGGLREASGDHALYVEPLTAKTLAQAIDLLIRDDDQRTGMARSGQRFVETHHTPAIRAAELARLRRRLGAMSAS
ncbi:glycosyltransferase family 4 protein [Brevundimonas sp.]